MSKYKFSLSAPVKSYVEWQLEHYHEDKRQLEQLKSEMIPSATSNYNFTGGGRASEPGNPTERSAIRMLTNPYILATERSIQAIDKTLSGCDEIDKKLIELIYWRRTHTPMGAGLHIGMSTTSVYKHLDKIQTRIAAEMGYITF